jgi:putative acetyltransferase
VGVPSPFTIEDARSEDAEAMLRVHRAAVRETAAAAYDEDVIEDWAPLPVGSVHVEELSARIARAEEIAVVARSSQGDLVGFGSIVPAASELRAVYVAPDHGRLGIGSMILGRLVDKASELGLVHLTMDASVNAKHFYVQHGFRIEGRAEHILRSGKRMACVKMRRDLLPATPREKSSGG